MEGCVGEQNYLVKMHHCPDTRDSVTIPLTLYEEDLFWRVCAWSITPSVGSSGSLHQMPEQSHGVLQFIVISVSVITTVG